MQPREAAASAFSVQLESMRLLGVADRRACGAPDGRPDRTGHHGPGDGAGGRLLFNAVAAGRQGQGSGAGQRQYG